MKDNTSDSNIQNYVKEDLLRKQVDPKWHPEYDRTFWNLANGDRRFTVPKANLTFEPIDYFKVWQEGLPAMVRMGIPQDSPEKTPFISGPWPPCNVSIYFTTTDSPSVLRYGQVIDIGCRQKEGYRMSHFTILQFQVVPKLEPSVNGKPARIIVKDQFDIGSILDWCLAESYFLE